MSSLFPDICAVILAGGESRRMGRDKALVEVGGRPLVARIADELRLLTDELWISANDAARYRFLAIPVIEDRFRGQGPLAGLHAAFVHSRRRYVAAVACDLPRVRASWLRGVLARADDWDAVIPRTGDGGVHPLCAVYSRACLGALERNLRDGINKVTEIFASGRLRVCWLEGSDGGFDDSDLANLNSPEDLQAFELSAKPLDTPFPTSGGRS